MFIQHPHLGFNGLTAIDLVSYDIITVSYTHLTLPTNREV